MNSSNKKNKDPIKFLIIGLDNCGKTSILKCLKGIKNLSAFNSPQPTRGAEVDNFEVLDSEYAIWDLGGQETYRNEYLLNFQEFLKGTTKIIYVFDIQDVKRYDVAIEYMEKVLGSIDRPEEIDFSIFLHKFDPDLQFSQELNEHVIDDLIKKIEEKIPPNFVYSLHKTSIYAIFEKTTIA
ncbi:MAG: ADP-ribosylation factor-like protein [Promethearchaeota archaeon]|jgi:GTPase SAR1 family protein